MVAGMNADTILRPCPVCGKQPRVSVSYAPGYGGWCVIQCKPLLRKPHLKVEEGKALLDSAIRRARVRWNREAERCSGEEKRCEKNDQN